MVLEGPLIHHLEVSKQGFVLAVLHVPFKTIWGINTVHSYFTIQNHNSEWFQMLHRLVWKRYQMYKCRRVNQAHRFVCCRWGTNNLPTTLACLHNNPIKRFSLYKKDRSIRLKSILNWSPSQRNMDISNLKSFFQLHQKLQDAVNF